ncbi:MAG TPA: hypothetical protein PLL30_08110 [Candidatus Krumholzibacteria bacterium]|nr:hypothetical protein [Candidatus Krumholzibacteria bacterium]HPD71720.1 hypothetical protein [Candidatus Krumholzibacteria bacterium]HRY41347.1 hypothetical protein [Candidatus Krumholzibacteria bacterium]
MNGAARGDVLQRLGRLDRRWLYLALFACLAATLWRQPLFRDGLSTFSRPVFERIEALPPGAPVLVSLDYSPASAPEVEPMALALTRHLLLRGARPVFVTLYPEGNNMLQRLRDQAIDADFPESREGRDWVALGYKAGRQMVINALRQDLATMYSADLRGAPIDSLPALAGVRRLDDFAIILALSSGTPGLKEWILYGGDPTGTPVAGGCTGIGAPEFLAYFPGQLVGLLGGLKGASEYEAALADRYPERAFPRRAQLAMGPQTVAHALILLFLVLGNLSYLRPRRRSPGRREGRTA